MIPPPIGSSTAPKNFGQRDISTVANPTLTPPKKSEANFLHASSFTPATKTGLPSAGPPQEQRSQLEAGQRLGKPIRFRGFFTDFRGIGSKTMSFGGFGSHAHESDLNGIIFHIFFEDVPRHSGQADTAIPRLSRSNEASSSCRTVGKLGGLGSFQDRVSVQELGAIQVPPEASFPFVPVCSHPPTPAKKETNTWWGGTMDGIN